MSLCHFETRNNLVIVSLNTEFRNKISAKWKRTDVCEWLIHANLQKMKSDTSVVWYALPWSTILDYKGSAESLQMGKLLTELISVSKNAYSYTSCGHKDVNRLYDVFTRLNLSCLLTPYNFYSQISFRVVTIPLYAANIEIKGRTAGIKVLTDGEKRKWLYSFIGRRRNTHLRNLLFTLQHPKTAFVRQVFYSSSSETSYSIYNSTMCNSSFTLCPGNSEVAITTRFWEALAVGSVPVIFINYRNFLPKLPSSFSWDTILVYIRSEMIPHLGKALSQYQPKEIHDMSKNGKDVYTWFTTTQYIGNIIKPGQNERLLYFPDGSSIKSPTKHKSQNPFVY